MWKGEGRKSGQMRKNGVKWVTRMKRIDGRGDQIEKMQMIVTEVSRQEHIEEGKGKG